MRLYKQNKLLDLTTIHQIKLNLIASEVVFFPFGFIEQSIAMWVENDRSREKPPDHPQTELMAWSCLTWPQLA